MNVDKKIGFKQFLKMFFFFLDKEDKRRFVIFVFLLMTGGFLSLISVASIIPILYILLVPEEVHKIPILKNFSYHHAVVISVVSMIFFYWLKSIGNILILRKQTKFLFGLARKIQLRIYDRYLKFSYTEHVKKNASALISMLCVDINTLSYAIFSPAGCFLNECITSAILFIALLAWEPGFTVWVFGGVLLAAKLYLNAYKKKAKIYGKMRTDNYKKLSCSIVQSLGSFKETKLYHKEKTFYNLAFCFADNITKSDSFNSIFSSSSRFIIESVAITVVLVFLAAAVFLGQSSEKIMTLISVFGVAAIQLLPSINRMVSAMGSIRFGVSTLEKVYDDFFQSKKPIFSKDKIVYEMSFFDKIRLENIYFSYNKNITLNNISISIPKGKKIAFVGSSGAGKTTLADIILGLILPDAGEIFVDNMKLTVDNLDQWQALIGYIPQMIYIYDSDIRQNIAFGVLNDDIDDDKIRLCLEKAALSDFVKNLPDGVHTKVGENGIQLSGGQRQRIGIARALYRDPSVLVMDEATAALDNKTEAEVTEALMTAGEDKTIITIAHRMSTIQHYDVIYFLDHGKIIASGSYQVLIKDSDAFRSFCSLIV